MSDESNNRVSPFLVSLASLLGHQGWHDSDKAAHDFIEDRIGWYVQEVSRLKACEASGDEAANYLRKLAVKCDIDAATASLRGRYSATFNYITEADRKILALESQLAEVQELNEELGREVAEYRELARTAEEHPAEEELREAKAAAVEFASYVEDVDRLLNLREAIEARRERVLRLAQDWTEVGV